MALAGPPPLWKYVWDSSSAAFLTMKIRSWVMSSPHIFTLPHKHQEKCVHIPEIPDRLATFFRILPSDVSRKAGNFSNICRNTALASAVKLSSLFWILRSDLGWSDKAQMLKPLDFPHSFP